MLFFTHNIACLVGTIFFLTPKLVRNESASACMQTNPFAWKLGDVGEPLKIDLLQPLASARLVLHPYEAADLSLRSR